MLFVEFKFESEVDAVVGIVELFTAVFFAVVMIVCCSSLATSSSSSSSDLDRFLLLVDSTTEDSIMCVCVYVYNMYVVCIVWSLFMNVNLTLL